MEWKQNVPESIDPSRLPYPPPYCGLPVSVWVGHDNDTFCEPVIRLLLFGRSLWPIPSLPCSSSMSRSWELLLWKMRGPIFPTYQAISVHGMDVLNLLGTSNHRFDLGQQYKLLEMPHASRIVDYCPKKPIKASRDLGKHSDAIQVQNQLAWKSRPFAYMVVVSTGYQIAIGYQVHRGTIGTTGFQAHTQQHSSSYNYNLP